MSFWFQNTEGSEAQRGTVGLVRWRLRRGTRLNNGHQRQRSILEQRWHAYRHSWTAEIILRLVNSVIAVGIPQVKRRLFYHFRTWRFPVQHQQLQRAVQQLWLADHAPLNATQSDRPAEDVPLSALPLLSQNRIWITVSLTVLCEQKHWQVICNEQRWVCVQTQVQCVWQRI